MRSVRLSNKPNLRGYSAFFSCQKGKFLNIILCSLCSFGNGVLSVGLMFRDGSRNSRFTTGSGALRLAISARRKTQEPFLLCPGSAALEALTSGYNVLNLRGQLASLRGGR